MPSSVFNPPFFGAAVSALSSLAISGACVAASGGASTIQRFESESGIPASRTSNLIAIRQALESAGVIFIDQTEESGPGVKLRNPI